MGRAGRPSTKRQPHKPGAPLPIPAAGCGPEQRLTVLAPKRTGNTLRLTLYGWSSDLLGTWRHRKKKRSHETVIDNRQYRAGRLIEHMIDVMAGLGKLRSPDLTVPVVDTSFVHRLGGDPSLPPALALANRLLELLGPRDLRFLLDVLTGKGIHGAMLAEAGYIWRLGDETPVSAAGGILSRGGPLKIVPKFADAGALEGGSFKVEDRQHLEALGRAGKIETRSALRLPPVKIALCIDAVGRPGEVVKKNQQYLMERDRSGSIHSTKHKLPHDNGFVVDEATEIEDTAKAAARGRIVANKLDIQLEAERDELQDLRGLKDPESRARREQLESRDDLVEILEVVDRALHSRRHPDDETADPATDALRALNKRISLPGDGARDAEFSIGETTSFEALDYKTTRERAIEKFGQRKIELASVRCRDLLTKIADFLETDGAVDREYADYMPAPEHITQRNDAPFEYAVFEELEPVLAHR